MKLLFSVQNQHIERIDSMYPVADSIDYLTARFSFSTSDWEGLTKTAIFRNGEEVFNVILDTNNECIVPWEVVKRGKLSVSLFAGNRITTDKCMVDIVASGYEPAQTPEEPTPTAYEQMIEILDNLKGGNAGKILTKATGNDYDFAWTSGGGGGGSSAYWGEILGEIEEQTDLQNALNAKANASNVYTKTETDNKFNPTNNFKTINGNSIIGTGDIPVSGGGGGTEVVANPELSGDEADLEGLKVGNTKYKVPTGGSNVVVNPILSGDEETATAIQIGDEKYVFPVVNTYGFTPAQITMFEGILRAGTYSSDQSSAITAFIESLSEQPEPTPKVLTSITAVLNNPTVEQGQTYTPNATVTAHYDDSSSAVVTSGISYSTIDTSTTGEKTLTISYTENEVTKTTTATVTVTAEPVPVTKVSISATKTKTSYTVGETFSTDDVVVTMHYSNGTTSIVPHSESDLSIGTVDTSTEGTKTLLIRYDDDGNTLETTIAITVVASGGGEVIYTASELTCVATTANQKFGDSHTPWVQGASYKYEFDYEVIALNEGVSINFRNVNNTALTDEFDITSTVGATGHIEHTMTCGSTRERQPFVARTEGYTLKLTNITITKLS